MVRLLILIPLLVVWSVVILETPLWVSYFVGSAAVGCCLGLAADRITGWWERGHL